MNEQELKDSFAKAYRILRAERAMWARVYSEGHPERADKLNEIDDVMAILLAYKDALKGYMGLDNPEPEQARLLDTPQKGGYA